MAHDVSTSPQEEAACMSVAAYATDLGALAYAYLHDGMRPEAAELYHAANSVRSGYRAMRSAAAGGFGDAASTAMAAVSDAVTLSEAAYEGAGGETGLWHGIAARSGEAARKALERVL